MKRSNQLYFEHLKHSNKSVFGGVFLKSNPKFQRPLSFKRPIHLVLKSGVAIGDFSFLKHSKSKWIYNLTRKLCRKFGIKLYRYANAGNHLHLLILPSNRCAYRAFIKSLTGLIARQMLGAQRGRALIESNELLSKKSKKRFWSARPFSRIVEWGKDYRQIYSYFDQNSLEAFGFIPYAPRKLNPVVIYSTA